jgi:probable HAF family extracellular repeat protein
MVPISHPCCPPPSTRRAGVALLLAVAGAPIGPLALPAHAQSLTGLGTLSGETDSLGFGVNADGTVVVGAAGSNNNYHRAFRWTRAGGMQDIGVPGLFAFAHAVSADGLVVVGVGDPDGGGNSAFRWSAGGGMVRLNRLPGWGYSDSYSVNADGSVVSGYCYSPTSKRAVRWTSSNVGGGVMEPLTTFQTSCPAPFWQGYGGISADGTVISGDGTAAGATCSGHAFRWTSDGAGGGTLEDLGHLPGQFATDSLAFGLSADGRVVVGSSQASNNDQAYRWSAATGMQDIGTALTGGEGWSEADAANADGSSVVGWAADPEIHAMLWTAAHGSVDLNVYLPTLGIDLTGWTLKYATSISADGRIIVGYGSHGATYNEAWIADLGPACYANCDASTTPPVLNINDFVCFQTRFAAGDSRANCDGSTTAPILTINDFVCFQTRFAAGCP